MNKKNLVLIVSISVLLNAFLLGMMVPTMFLHQPPHGPGGPPNPASHMRDALGVLDQPYRDQVAAILDSKEKAIDDHMDHLHGIFEQTQSLLTSPDFTIDKIRALDKTIADEDVGLKSEISGMIADIASKLPQQERIKFFEKALPPRHGEFMPPH